MTTPSANQPSTISDDRYFIELKERQLDKCAKMGKFSRLALAFKPRRLGIPAEEMEIMLRAMKRENDEAERKLRDEIDKEKKRQSEPSSSNLQDCEDCIASLLQLFCADQEMGEISDRLRAPQLPMGIEPPQVDVSIRDTPTNLTLFLLTLKRNSKSFAIATGAL